MGRNPNWRSRSEKVIELMRRKISILNELINENYVRFSKGRKTKRDHGVLPRRGTEINEGNTEMKDSKKSSKNAKI